jgi:hypothetical protein
MKIFYNVLMDQAAVKIFSKNPKQPIEIKENL